MVVGSFSIYCFAQAWFLSFACSLLYSFRSPVLFALRASIGIQWWSASFEQIAGVISRECLFAEEEMSWRGVGEGGVVVANITFIAWLDF